MKNFVLAMMIAMISQSFPFASAHSLNEIMVDQKIVEESTENYDIKMDIPILGNLKDQNFEQTFNQIIMDDIFVKKDEFVNAVEDNANIIKEHNPDFKGQLMIENDVLQTGQGISVLLKEYSYVGGAHGNEMVSYYNFINEENTKLLQLNDLFMPGSDYIAVINDVIEEQMKEKIEKGDVFFEGDMGFQTIAENQHFYFTEKGLVIAFDKYDIAPGVAGIPEFIIPYETIQEMMKPEIKKQLNLQ